MAAYKLPNNGDNMIDIAELVNRQPKYTEDDKRKSKFNEIYLN